MTLKNLLSDIHALSNPEKAIILQRFFKTGKGQYGEGDVFLGLTMPQTRSVVKKYLPPDKGGKGGLALSEIDELLGDKHHEIRMAGVLMLVHFAQKKIYPLEDVARKYMSFAGGSQKRSNSGAERVLEQSCTDMYSERETQGQAGRKSFSETLGINNWDLIDVSSEHIIGPYIQECLTHEERVKFIDECIASPSIWVNRIIVLASFHQIKQGNEKLTFYIAERMLGHKHDLMHKAVGWMLREVGKRCSMDELRGFLDQYAQKMPRTMLRYSIEKMGEDERKKYMTSR